MFGPSSCVSYPSIGSDVLLQTYSGFTLLLTVFRVLNSSCLNQEFDFVQRTEIGALEYQIAVNLVTDRGPSRVLGSQLEPPVPSQTQNLAKEKRTCNVCDQTFAVMYKRAHVKESPSRKTLFRCNGCDQTSL